MPILKRLTDCCCWGGRGSWIGWHVIWVVQVLAVLGVGGNCCVCGVGAGVDASAHEEMGWHMGWREGEGRRSCVLTWIPTCTVMLECHGDKHTPVSMSHLTTNPLRRGNTKLHLGAPEKGPDWLHTQIYFLRNTCLAIVSQLEHSSFDTRSGNFWAQTFWTLRYLWQNMCHITHSETVEAWSELALREKVSVCRCLSARITKLGFVRTWKYQKVGKIMWHI